MKNTAKLPPVLSLQDLYNKACVSSTYVELAMSAARNLGGDPRNLDGAMKVLRMNAMETDSEEGVVDEINFCR